MSVSWGGDTAPTALAPPSAGLQEHVRIESLRKKKTSAAEGPEMASSYRWIYGAGGSRRKIRADRRIYLTGKKFLGDRRPGAAARHRPIKWEKNDQGQFCPGSNPARGDAPAQLVLSGDGLSRASSIAPGLKLETMPAATSRPSTKSTDQPKGVFAAAIVAGPEPGGVGDPTKAAGGPGNVIAT